MQCGGVNLYETDANNKFFCAGYFCYVFKNSLCSVKEFNVFSIINFFESSYLELYTAKSCYLYLHYS